MEQSVLYDVAGFGVQCCEVQLKHFYGQSQTAQAIIANWTIQTNGNPQPKTRRTLVRLLAHSGYSTWFRMSGVRV